MELEYFQTTVDTGIIRINLINLVTVPLISNNQMEFSLIAGTP